ncbi:zinc finger protein 414 [Rhinophrynus dorsalis]
MNVQDSAEKEEQPNNVAPPAKQSSSQGARMASKRTREGGRKRLLHPARRGHRCSSYGCNRIFQNMQDLISHVSVHIKPTQSMNDKQFLCSVSGCREVLGSMQDLMTHLKVHYKPNRYFKCENCMQHFRTHRSLFKHLHVCSDPTSPSFPLSLQPPPPTVDVKPPAPVQNQTSVIKCIKKETLLPAAAAADLPTTALSSSSLPEDLHSPVSSLVSQASNPFSLLDPSLFAGRLPGPSTSSAGTYLPYLHSSAYSLPQVSIPQRLRPFLGNQDLPISNAMWKKNQGHSTNSRILWEHTRDSYNCMQCTFSTASREQMTKHIEELHKTPPSTRLQDEIDYDLDLLPFHSKISPEMEPSVFPQM